MVVGTSHGSPEPTAFKTRLLRPHVFPAGTQENPLRPKLFFNNICFVSGGPLPGLSPIPSGRADRAQYKPIAHFLFPHVITDLKKGYGGVGP